MMTRRPARAAIVALTVAAVAAPTVSAGDIVPRRDGSKAVYVPADTTPDRHSGEDGLQWDDAALGAGATTGLALVCAAVLSGRRRRRALRVEPIR